MYKLTLNSLFDYTNDDGIFTYLASQNVPWKNDVDSDLLDLDYHSKHGTKVVSKTVTSLLDEDGLSSANKTKLAKLLYTKNKSRWDELWGSMGLYDDFNPLDNTNWTETETIEHHGTDSKTQTIGQKQTTFQEGQQTDTFNKGSQSNSSTIGQQTFTEGSQSDTTGQQVISDSAQTNQTGAHIDTKETKKSAYNSGSYSPDVQETDNVAARSDTVGAKTTTNGERTDTKGSREDTTSSRSDSSTEGAREDSSTKGQRTDTTTEGSQSNSESGSDSYTDTHTISRAGNIGVTTSGQLIDDFRRVVNWQFFEIIYKDIDAILCLEVFGCDDDDFSDYKIVTPYKLPIASSSVLGGIKVGQNLSIASDGTLNAQGGGVTSVNGKSGEVTLDASDVGAASASDMTTAKADIVNIKLDINQLQGSVLDLTNRTSTNEGDIVNIKLDINQLQGSVLGLHNDLLAVRQVPTGGTEGQVLTKGASGYDWQTPQTGGGFKCVNVFHSNVYSQYGSGTPIAFTIDEGTFEIDVNAPRNSNERYGTITSQMIMGGHNMSENAITSIFSPFASSNWGCFQWDEKIGFLMPVPFTGLTFYKFYDVFVKTHNKDYENKAVYTSGRCTTSSNSVTLSNLLNKQINHIAVAYRVDEASRLTGATISILRNNIWEDISFNNVISPLFNTQAQGIYKADVNYNDISDIKITCPNTGGDYGVTVCVAAT